MSMDRAIEKRRRPWWHWTGFALAGSAITWFGWQALADASIRTYRVPAQQVVISSVSLGAFEDIIPIRATVQPFNSVFLDAVEGGVVQEIYVDEGSFVEVGQPLLQFSNTDLRLNVAMNDTGITEQLNNLNNIANDLEIKKISTEREILDTKFKITTLERLEARQQQLAGESLIAAEQYEATVDELDYLHKLLANIQERQKLETRIREERLRQIANQIAKLEDNQALSQTSFENLLVRAPISGQLTSFPVEIGENKTRGQRLGQIDVIDRYKVVAQIDEFYVTRVAPGQQARFGLAGQEFTAVVDKVYPQITDGTFTVDLIFDEATPTQIRRGQTLQMNLTLGSPTESLLLPVGGFVQDTGGNWAFVLDATGQYATRRDIRVGRRNNRYIEVQEGLEVGERVITSSYSAMTDMERIQLEP